MIKPITFTVLAPPRTKKNSPCPVPAKTKDGRSFTRILPSAAYRIWFKEAMKQSLLIRAQLARAGHVLPLAGLVNCQALVYRHAAIGDLLGYLEGIADWMQEPRRDPKNPAKLLRPGAGIIRDDRQIIAWDGSRPLKDTSCPRVEVTLTVLADKPEPQDLFSEEEPF